MTTAQLRLQYHKMFGYASHSNHMVYLFRRLAWRLQSLAEGDLSERARQFHCKDPKNNASRCAV
jgi:hypothetical protein